MSSVTRDLSYEGVRRGKRKNSADMAAFSRAWSRWYKIVQLHAQKHPGRKRVQPAEYAEIYRSLLESVSVLGAASDGERRARFADIVELVTPWPSNDNFLQAERAMLFHLAEEIRRLSKVLGVGLPGDPAAVVRFVLKLVLAVGVLGGLYLVADRFGFSVVSSMQLNALWLWRKAWSMSELEKIFAFIVCILLVSIYNMSRTRAS